MLRDLIIDEIKRYGFLDFDYRPRWDRNKPIEESMKIYSEYLKALPDDELLSTYNSVREASFNLD